LCNDTIGRSLTICLVPPALRARFSGQDRLHSSRPQRFPRHSDEGSCFRLSSTSDEDCCFSSLGDGELLSFSSLARRGELLSLSLR
jgi:hypothetical protein